MTKYDAFGRPVGEDPLASLRPADDAATTADDYVSPEAVHVEQKPLEGIPGAPRVIHIGRIVRLFSVLVTLGVVGAVGYGIFNTVDDAIDSVTDAVTPVTPEAPTLPPEAREALENARRQLAEAQEAPTPSTPAATPQGVGRGSLLQRRAFGDAMRRLRTSGLGRLKLLRVAPERIDAQLLTKGGRLRNVQISHTGELRKLSLSGSGFGALETIPFARVNSAAPYRLAAAAAGRLKRSANGVSYLVFVGIQGQTMWNVFFKNGRHFQGDASGRITRQVT